MSIRTVCAQTGTYFPIPDSGVVWNFRETSGWCGSTADYSIITDGDTLINSVTYRKLFTLYVLSANPSCFQSSVGYRGAFRNDSADRSVYYLPPLDSVEHLLYDFTWQQGDTIQGWLRSNGISPAVIDRVDSVLVGNHYHRRIQIDCYDVDLIEGVGSTYGLITGLPGCVTDVNDIRLECFSVNGQPLYPDTVSSCFPVNSTDGPEQQPIAVYPAPASGPIRIRVPDSGVYYLQLVDETGKCIYRNTVELVAGVEAIIETVDLPSGVSGLLLTDKSSGSMFSRKVVILH
ncbi:MAG: hypothetical protein RL021_954 [Bacteroidota bacterium]